MSAKRIGWLFGWLALFCVLLTLAGRWLVYADPLATVDVVGILSGNDESRISEGASLYADHIAYNLILTATNQTYGDYDFPYSMLQVEMLSEMGVPDGAIYIAEVSSKNTGQEAYAIKSRMYDLGFTSVMVVTDAWHTRRTKMIFEDSFKNTGFKVFIHPVTDMPYNKNLWWLSAEGWKNTVSEYVRILGFIIKRDTNIPDYPNL